MNPIRITVLFLFGLLMALQVSAQTDNILWGALKLQKPLSAKWGIALQPFIRMDENFSSYLNTSIDLSVRYNIDKKWHTQVLSRSWLIPDAPDRQFVWFDVAYKTPVTILPVHWTNRLRWHIGLDINDQQDADFIRHLSQVRLLNKGRFHPIFGVELWWQTQLRQDLTRLRIEPGFRYDFNPGMNLLFLWRRENFINIETPRSQNLWVLIWSFDL